MKHLEHANPSPRGLRRLLRPGPRPWFHRPEAAATEPRNDRASGIEAAERDAHGTEFESLVELYAHAMRLRDRARAETRVGEDALSIGDELKASQHFSFGDHYRRRAERLEAAAHHRAAPLEQDHDDCRLAAAAIRAARARQYGSPDLENRPEFL